MRLCQSLHAAVLSGACFWGSEAARGSEAACAGSPDCEAVRDDTSKLASANQANAIAGLGYGWGNDGGVNRWKLGVSFALSYTFQSGVNLGVFFDYFRGETVKDGTRSTEGRYFDFGIGSGYDFAISEAWVFRLRGDVGFAGLFTRKCALDVEASPAIETCGEAADSEPMVGAGASIFYLAKWSFFLEVRELFAFPDDGRLVYATALLIGFWPTPYQSN